MPQLILHAYDTNDAPVVGVASVTGVEDTSYVFTWADFATSDVDNADSDLSIRISSLPADGVLEYFDGTGWISVQANDVISYAECAF